MWQPHTGLKWIGLGVIPCPFCVATLLACNTDQSVGMTLPAFWFLRNCSKSACLRSPETRVSDILNATAATVMPLIAPPDRRIGPLASEAADYQSIDPARVEALAEAIRTARVGGAFWKGTGAWGDSSCDAWTWLDSSGCLPADDPLAALVAVAGGNVVVSGTTARLHADGRARLIHDALFGQWRWRHPLTGEPCEPEEVIEVLACWRRHHVLSCSIDAVAGVAWWKRQAIASLLSSDGSAPAVLSNGDEVAEAVRRSPGRIALWPSRVDDCLVQDARAGRVRVQWLEDGFLRSAGLGSDCHPPLSIALDRQRPHFDPSGPSDLESRLQHGRADQAALARARRLIDRVVTGRLGKYGRGGAVRPAIGGDRFNRTVLVAGQVSDDLSMRFGAPDIRTNLDLLRRVEEHERGRAGGERTNIVFKPHPDVARGHRRGAIAAAKALRHCDAVTDLPMVDLLDEVDAVHVATSLTGFEALLRGREVHCHGQPFYAGWGLTTDHGPPVERRTRRLSVEELAGTALIDYPLYLDPVTGWPCPAELFVERMLARVERPTWLSRLRVAQGRIRRQWRPSC